MAGRRAFMRTPRALLKWVAILLLASGHSAVVASTLPLMPMPSSVTLHDGTMPLSGAWAVGWSNCGSSAMNQAFRRFELDFLKLTGVDRSSDNPVSVSVECETTGAAIDAMRAEAY